MATETSQAPFIQRGQVPAEIEDDDDVTIHQHAPTANEKSGLIPSTTSPASEYVAPPAYTPDSELPIPIFNLPDVPSESSRPSHLRKPIAIPAIDASSDAPFLRAYAPKLNEYNLPKESFLAFLDHLNQVVASSPPLQVLDAAGGILKSVPILFPLHIVGAAFSGLANLSGTSVSKSRSDRAIRDANRDIFGPRGLKLEIAKLDALAHMAGIPILDSKGKINQKATSLMVATEGNAGAANMQGHDPVQRQVRAFSPWVADLDLETLPWTSKSKLTRFNAALKKRQGGSRSKSDDHSQAAEERQHKLKLAAEDRDRSLLKLDREEQQARSSLHEGSKEILARVSRTIAQDKSEVLGRYEEEVNGINKGYAGENLEEAWPKKILWLVIRDVNAEGGAMRELEGI